jgi:hypothetical protein
VTADEKRLWCRLHGYSTLYQEYWVGHPSCEVCHTADSEPPHHLKTRGAGGDDSYENLLALCAQDHRRIHTLGDAEMARRVGGVVGEKILAAKGTP